MLRGIAASAGIGIGRAVIVRPEAIEVPRRTVLSLGEEKQRFLDAVEIFVEEVQQAQAVVQANVGADEAAILGAQIAIIRDQELIKEVLRTIERQQVNVEYAFHIICNGYIALFTHIEDELISARSADFQDIRDRMLRILMGVRSVDLSTVPKGSVVVAEDIPPSQAAGIDPERIAGIVTRRGTRFSHISIIARALQLPAVVAVEELFDRVQGGEDLILDGNRGHVWVNPDQGRLAEYRRHVLQDTSRYEKLERYRDLPTVTEDGHPLRLAANYAVEQELTVIRDDRADGIGLYRTEFLFMDRPYPPGEQEQYETYRQVIQAMDGKPVVIRTLDVGGDKDVPYLFAEREENPYLGHRGIRFCLDRPDIFKVQLKAILRAAAHGNVHLMLPMITGMGELKAAKRVIQEVERELHDRGDAYAKSLPLGVMVETPAAVMCARELAKTCDFFSIGTNDLTQYTLSVDRGNHRVAHLYDTLHPAVLRMIAMTAKGAHDRGIPVAVCGEAAADAMMIPLLIGFGIDELSVNAGALLSIRQQISGLSHRKCRDLAHRILQMHSSAEVRQILEEERVNMKI